MSDFPVFPSDTPAEPPSETIVETALGALRGRAEGGLRIFLGVPFAEPPVGPLRWRPPRPLEPWEGVRDAVAFGPRAMQLPVFGDMNFRSPGMDEDCLFLNVWTPARPDPAGHPVLVYFHGGGNIAGDGSEPRYDGAALARRGLVVVTANSRLGVFGFLAHPELTRESGEGGSGNQGYLDQVAALRWVRDHIAAFGGDPARVTIAGESAGSVAVSAHLVSPLARGLFAGAIGSSGSLLGTLPPRPLAEAEALGAAFAARLGARDLADLRARPAAELLAASGEPGAPPATATLDGVFLPRPPAEVYAAGDAARVPLLVGWNSEEMNGASLLGPGEATVARYDAALRERFGDAAAELRRLYPAATDGEAAQAATDLAGNLFIGQSTWRWAEAHAASGGPVFRYLYAHPRPPTRPEFADAVPGLAGGVTRGVAPVPPPAARGAVHSADIEYFMGNLATNPVYAWTDADARVSEAMQRAYAHFATRGDPNGPGLPEWPPLEAGAGGPVARLDPAPTVGPDPHHARHLGLEAVLAAR